MKDIILNIKKDIEESFMASIEYDNILKVSVPLYTLNDKVASVFVVVKDSEIIITDNGWLDMNYYEEDYNEESAIIANVRSQFLNKYNVSTVQHNKTSYYYIKITDKKHAANAILKLAQFVVSFVDSSILKYKHVPNVNDTFKSQVDNKLKHSIEKIENASFLSNYKVDDVNVKFSGAISTSRDVSLFSYISANTKYTFSTSLHKSLSNVVLLPDSSIYKFINKIYMIIDDRNPNYLEEYDYHIKKTSKLMGSNPILWSDETKLDFGELVIN